MSNAYDTNDPVSRPDQNQPPPPSPPNQTNQPPPQGPNPQVSLPRDLDPFGKKYPPLGLDPSPAQQRPPPQGAPPPTWPPAWRPNQRQMFIPSQANRPPQDWGSDPAFPQLPDMWQVPGVYRGLAQQLARFGSYRTGLMAANLGRMTDAYEKGFTRGQRDYSRLRHQQMVGAADELQNTMQEELAGYGTLYGSYSGNPTQLHDQLMNKAIERGDREMQAALNVSPQAAERLQQWRQAKFDDLHRSNTARRNFDADLRARNPFLVNPVGPDGLPTERLPLPNGLDHNAFSLGTRDPGVQLASAVPGTDEYYEGGKPGTGMDADDPDSAEYDDQPREEPPPRVPANRRIGDTGQNQPARAGAPPQNLPFKPSPRWPDQPPPDDGDVPKPEDRPVNPGLDPRGEDRPWPIPEEPEKNYPLRRRRDSPYDRAEQQGRVQMAQADTGTATDAPTLPQITVRPGEQPEEDQDGRTVWDDVRLRSQLRQAREDAGRAGGGAGTQPADQTGAGQPGQPGQQGPQPQAQPAARGGGAGEQDGQPSAVPQAPDQVAEPTPGASATQPKPQAKAPAPGVSPAADEARKNGQDADFIEGFGAQWAIGQQTTSGLSRSGLKPQEREAIFKRGTEIRNQMFGVINDPNIKEGDRDAVLAAVNKINPQIGAEMRGILDGSVTPRKDTPYWVYQLAHKADPSINTTTFKSRADTLKLHTAGKMGENRMKLGTAVFHAYDLLHLLEGINKPGGISATNIWEEEHLPNIIAGKAMPLTSAMMGAINRAKETTAREYNTVMSYTGPGTLTERSEMKLSLDPQNPEKAIADVRKMIDEMKVRNAELKKNFEVGWGGSYDAVMKNYDPARAFPGSDQEDQLHSREGLRLLDSGAQSRQPSGPLNQGLPRGWSIEEH